MASADRGERGEGGALSGQEVGKENAEEGEDEDERLLQEFEEEIADLSVPSAKIDSIKEEMQKEFDDIIDEVQNGGPGVAPAARLLMWLTSRSKSAGQAPCLRV